MLRMQCYELSEHHLINDLLQLWFANHPALTSREGHHQGEWHVLCPESESLACADQLELVLTAAQCATWVEVKQA